MTDQATAPGTPTLQLGAIPVARGTRFLVWAPFRRQVNVVVDGRAHELAPQGEGYFGGLVAGATAGDRYWLELDGDLRRPDPASRFQPEGPHGPSQVVDARFAWTDSAWIGPTTLHGQVVYELHVGTFTPDGTWAAAERELPRLAALGVTMLEVMPINEFNGRFGWGYDGVDLFAPFHGYGAPDDVRRFVDAAHRLGLAVILDVVYNHFGPSGNYLRDFSADYFSSRHENEWGEAINFDGADAPHVRRFFVENAVHWILEYHLDGLRLDATQALHDRSPVHIVVELVDACRAAAGERHLYFVAENEPQDVSLLRGTLPNRDGVDALWNDDWHHSAVVAATGRRDAYFTDYLGNAHELVAMAKHGFLYQGQWYSWQKKPRGTPTLGLRSSAFVAYLDNHDQVANTGIGARLHHLTDPARWRALTGLLLLGPATPMLFQGQEFAASTRFCYFADHGDELDRLVAEGRLDFLAQFDHLALDEMRERLPPPADPDTFASSKLVAGEWREPRHAQVLELHRDLLALRRGDAVLSLLGTPAVGIEGSVLAGRVVLLRYHGAKGERLLVVNLGADCRTTLMNDPLAAPPAGRRWVSAWSSESPRYGGRGGVSIVDRVPWIVHGATATLLVDEPR